jgi:membrane dipeptidase
VIIDGHNDLIVTTWRGDRPRHLDLDAARAAGYVGGFFAIWVPSPDEPWPADVPYSVPLPKPIPTKEAARAAAELYAAFLTLPVDVARSVDDFQPGRITAILHLEGADPLAPDLSDLELWLERGVTSIGLVWSRPNAFAEGVPSRYPSSPDVGGGLTRAGRDLVRACNRDGVVVDLSHLNEAGFWDVARLTTAPLVATHSNVHALCPIARNLTDRQLDAIRDSNGIVGVNFAVAALRADGRNDAATPIEEIVRHVDYLVDRMGIDHVGFGSDFEGALLPDSLDGAAGLPRLVDALGRRYDAGAVAKLTHGNWLRVLDATWT